MESLKSGPYTTSNTKSTVYIIPSLFICVRDAVYNMKLTSNAVCYPGMIKLMCHTSYAPSRDAMFIISVRSIFIIKLEL